MIKNGTNTKVKELILKENEILDNELMKTLYGELSIYVDDYGYCMMLDVAIAMFGDEAYEYMCMVSMGLKVSYMETYDNRKYICYEGFNIMKQYRAYCIMKEKLSKDFGTGDIA